MNTDASNNQPSPQSSLQPSPQPEPGFLTRLGPAGLLGILALALPPLGGIALLTYTGTVSDWLRSHAEAGLFIYVACFIVLAGLALLPTYAQAALGGFAFGWVLGLPAALVGFVGAAWVGYEIARRASGERVERLIAEKPKWQAIRDALVRDHERHNFWKTVGMIALLRCPPNSPFAFSNLVMASVKVPRVPFLLGTLIGMTPRTAAAVVIGSTLERFTREDLNKAAPAWVWGVGVGLTLVVVIVVASVADRAVKKIAGQPRPQNPA